MKTPANRKADALRERTKAYNALEGWQRTGWGLRIPSPLEQHLAQLEAEERRRRAPSEHRYGPDGPSTWDPHA